MREYRFKGIIHPMEQPPDFLHTPLKIMREETFRPAPISRKGEIIAWLLTLLIGLVSIIVKMQSGHFPCLTILLLVFFLIAAILISFSHWADSKTLIRVTPPQLSYQSPFRKIQQDWDQVLEINAQKTGRFWRIVVNLEQSFFSFKVNAASELKTQPEQVLALPQGDRLVRIICGMANLLQIQNTEENWICKRTSSPEMIDA
jgi:nicotinamide riboside transporter PnuC